MHGTVQRRLNNFEKFVDKMEHARIDSIIIFALFHVDVDTGCPQSVSRTYWFRIRSTRQSWYWANYNLLLFLCWPALAWLSGARLFGDALCSRTWRSWWLCCRCRGTSGSRWCGFVYDASDVAVEQRIAPLIVVGNHWYVEVEVKYFVAVIQRKLRPSQRRVAEGTFHWLRRWIAVSTDQTAYWCIKTIDADGYRSGLEFSTCRSLWRLVRIQVKFATFSPNMCELQSAMHKKH